MRVYRIDPLLFALLLFVLLLPAFGYARAVDRLEKTMDKEWWFGESNTALRALKKSELEEAQTRFQLLKEKEPGELKHLYNLGLALYKGKNYKRAIKAFDSASVAPDLRHASLFNLANSYWQNSDKKNAVETLEKLITENPEKSLLKQANENLEFMKTFQPPKPQEKKKNKNKDKNESKKDSKDQNDSSEQQEGSSGEEKEDSQGGEQSEENSDGSSKKPSEEQSDGESDSDSDSGSNSAAEGDQQDKDGSESEKEDDSDGGNESNESNEASDKDATEKKPSTKLTPAETAKRFEENQVRKQLRSLPDYVGKRRYHIRPEDRGETDLEAPGENSGERGTDAPRW